MGGILSDGDSDVRWCHRLDGLSADFTEASARNRARSAANI